MRAKCMPCWRESARATIHSGKQVFGGERDSIMYVLTHEDVREVDNGVDNGEAQPSSGKRVS
jgi:hypothetical protein